MVRYEGCCFPFVVRAALFSVFLAAGTVGAFGISITVTGSPGFSIDAADLSGGAGSDFIADHSNADNAILVTVVDTTGDTDAWQIQVRQTDVLWHGSLDLALLRTGTGSGTGSVSGGNLLPVTLTAVDQVFFEGEGNMTDIPLRMDLSGVSVLIPVDTYSATLNFTIVDLP